MKALSKNRYYGVSPSVFERTTTHTETPVDFTIVDLFMSLFLDNLMQIRLAYQERSLWSEFKPPGIPEEMKSERPKSMTPGVTEGV